MACSSTWRSTNLSNFSQHHDLLELVISLRHAMHSISTTGTSIVLLILLRAFTCNVPNLSGDKLFSCAPRHRCFWYLSVFSVLAFHSHAAALAFLVGLIPVVPDKVTTPRAIMTDSVLRQHTQVHR